MGLKRIEHSENLYRTSKSGLIDPDRHVRGPGITPSRIFDMRRGSQMYLIRSVSFTTYCRETGIYRRVDTPSQLRDYPPIYFYYPPFEGTPGLYFAKLIFFKLISWKRKQFTFRELFSRHSTTRRCPTLAA